jgi:hypothetical protein
MTDTIKPPWAFSLWSNSDHIFAELPAIDGQTSHVVKVPNNEKGLAKLLVLAKARDVTSQLGHKGDPTQWQISKPSYDPKLVKKIRAKIEYTAEQRIATRTILRELGLI